LFEKTALAIKEGVSGMDGHPDWENRQTRSLAGVHPNDILQVKYSIGEKKNLLTRNMIYCPLT
jgi:hypothetical protein